MLTNWPKDHVCQVNAGDPGQAANRRIEGRLADEAMNGHSRHQESGGNCSMRSARAEAYWQAFRRHEGINSSHYEATYFRTPPEVADSLLELMSAGVMRATASPMPIFGPEHEEPVPEVGDYAVLLDTHNRPQLIWRTTGTSVGPLSSVTDRFIWQSGDGSGERENWLAQIGGNFRRNAKQYGFEMHADIETVFETLEVVWPKEVARRVRLVSSQLDRGISLLQRLNEQQHNTDNLEAVLARIETAVLTVGHAMAIGFSNPAGEALLRRGDGLLIKNGRLAARLQADDRNLAAALSDACGRSSILVSSIKQASAGTLVSIHRDEDRPPYRASIFPLRREHAARQLASKTDAVLFVDDPNEADSPAPADLYTRAFRFTPAEARLAVRLASGVSLTETADEFGVTHNTVRAQLRAIFDKTETHRQSDLVRLLQRSSSLRITLS
jgi:uncharacterized protein YhfF/DNA-binding CsgD family transcriptional regulator